MGIEQKKIPRISPRDFPQSNIIYLIALTPILQDRAVVVIVGLLEELPDIIPRGFTVVELEEFGCTPMLGHIPASG